MSEFSLKLAEEQIGILKEALALLEEELDEQNEQRRMWKKAYRNTKAENAELKRLLTSMTCGECDETMLDCTCPDTKALLTGEQDA